MRMTDIKLAHGALVTRVLGRDGRAPRDMRPAAFDDADLAEPMATLIDKVAHRAYQITDEDVAAVRAAGLDEDQIFEIVVCAAIGEATRQYERGLAALIAATGEN